MYFTPINTDEENSATDEAFPGIFSDNELHVTHLQTRRSLPLIKSSISVDSGNRDKDNDSRSHYLSVSPSQSPFQRRAFSRPTSPHRSPSSSVLSTRSLSPAPPSSSTMSRSLSPAAFSRIMRTPSPQHLSRDCQQPKEGSLSSVHSPISTEDEEGEESDTVSFILGGKSITDVTKKRKMRARNMKNRPPTPPALATEIAAVSQQLSLIAIKDKFRIPERDMAQVLETN